VIEVKNKKYVFAIFMLILLLAAGCSNETKKEPPEAIVKINGESINAAKGTYQWEIKGVFSREAVIADAAAPFQIAKDMKVTIVEQSSEAVIEFRDGSNPQLHAYLWEGEERGGALPLKQHYVTLPAKKGKYVVEINAKWSNGDSSYTFVVEVK
jgi:hypothetical protein